MPVVKEIEIVVRGYHLDFYQHVNNARYLEFLEEARWSFMEEKKTIEWLKQHGLAIVIVNINMNFRRAAVLYDRLIIKTQTVKFGTKSLVIHQDIFLKDTDIKIHDADTTLVILDAEKQKTVEISEEIRDLFA